MTPGQTQWPAESSLRRIGLIAATVVVFAGCSASGSPATVAPDPRPAVCAVMRPLDADCDHVIDIHDRYPGVDDLRVDTDRDGVVDIADRYAGNDFGDDDRDGWSNAWDPAPLDPHQTIAEMIARSSQQQQTDYTHQQLVATAQNNGLANTVSALEALDAILAVTDRDTDGDGQLDVYDTQATLDAYDDDDGDGESNWSDLFPTDPSDY